MCSFLSKKNTLRYFINLEIETRFNDTYSSIFYYLNDFKAIFQKKNLRCSTELRGEREKTMTVDPM